MPCHALPCPALAPPPPPPGHIPHPTNTRPVIFASLGTCTRCSHISHPPEQIPTATAPAGQSEAFPSRQRAPGINPNRRGPPRSRWLLPRAGGSAGRRPSNTEAGILAVVVPIVMLSRLPSSGVSRPCSTNRVNMSYPSGSRDSGSFWLTGGCRRKGIKRPFLFDEELDLLLLFSSSFSLLKHHRQTIQQNKSCPPSKPKNLLNILHQHQVPPSPHTSTFPEAHLLPQASSSFALKRESPLPVILLFDCPTTRPSHLPA